MNAPRASPDKYAGAAIHIAGLGHVRLTRPLADNSETAVYQTDHPGVAVKMFDLGCAQADEIGYGPYVNFQAELATFEEIQASEVLRAYVPSYFGAHIDYERKCASIAMELLDGGNLAAWAVELAGTAAPHEFLTQFHFAAGEMLAIVGLFHRHGMLLLDLKPDNVIRLRAGGLKVVDLGAFYTPRHRGRLKEFAYAATPDHAEVVIDVSNLQAGTPPSAASDLFSAGVSLFEMATGSSRLVIDAHTADEMLADPALYRFRDSQIADVWRAFPHLREALPLVRTQLQERRLLFAEFWHLLKAFLAQRVQDWESLDHGQQDQILMSTGATFIHEQLPEHLTWLARAITRATILRSLRVTDVAELHALLGQEVPEHVQADLESHNGLVRSLRQLEVPADFAGRLSTWEVRHDRRAGHWAIAAPVAARHLESTAELIFLALSSQDEEGHTFWRVVDESAADLANDQPATVARLGADHTAWLG